MLRQAARDRGIPIYAIKNSTSSSLVRAFRTLMGVDPAAGNSFARAGGATGEGCRACAAAAWAAVDHPNVPALCVHRCQHALLAAWVSVIWCLTSVIWRLTRCSTSHSACCSPATT